MTKSLTNKLAEVMDAVERVPKNGRNEFHRYDYALEADIVAVVRKELASRHVMLIPSVESMTREAVGDKGQVLTTLSMTFTFKDGESGEEITRAWLGTGVDKEDKGAYKAMTGGEKYFLMKTFLMPTGDDPETEQALKHQPRGTEEHREQAKTASVATASVAQSMRRPAPPAVRSAEHRTQVASMDKRTGSSAKGPWTLHIIKFSDGREGTTFSDSIAELADDAMQTGADIDLTLVPGKKPGSFEVMSLMPVRQLNEHAGPVNDEDIPF